MQKKLSHLDTTSEKNIEFYEVDAKETLHEVQPHASFPLQNFYDFVRHVVTQRNFIEFNPLFQRDLCESFL